MIHNLRLLAELFPGDRSIRQMKLTAKSAKTRRDTREMDEVFAKLGVLCVLAI
jgi:hypothetical protein